MSWGEAGESSGKFMFMKFVQGVVMRENVSRGCFNGRDEMTDYVSVSGNEEAWLDWSGSLDADPRIDWYVQVIKGEGQGPQVLTWSTCGC